MQSTKCAKVIVIEKADNSRWNVIVVVCDDDSRMLNYFSRGLWVLVFVTKH